MTGFVGDEEGFLGEVKVGSSLVVEGSGLKEDKERGGRNELMRGGSEEARTGRGGGLGEGLWWGGDPLRGYSPYLYTHIHIFADKVQT